MHKDVIHPRLSQKEKSGSLPAGLDDMKDELRTDGDPIAWSTSQFPGEQGMFTDMFERKNK